MAKVRDGNAADLSQRINVAFYTGQINRCLCNYWRGLQRISEASPPEDVTVGQVQRVGHSRLDPDCTSRSEEHTSELQSLRHLVCRLLLEKKKADELV